MMMEPLKIIKKDDTINDSQKKSPKNLMSCEIQITPQYLYPPTNLLNFINH